MTLEENEITEESANWAAIKIKELGFEFGANKSKKVFRALLSGLSIGYACGKRNADALIAQLEKTEK